MHSLAYVLDPEFVEHEDVFCEPDVSAGVQTMLERLAPNQIDECYFQLRKFRAKMGSFSKASVWERAKAMNPHEFWEMHGAVARVARSESRCHEGSVTAMCIISK